MERCRERQGDVLAPILFNLFLDAITAATLSQHAGSGVKMLFNRGDSSVGSMKKMREEVSIQDLEYADDMTLASDSMDVLEEVLRTLHTTCFGMGLSISCKKFLLRSKLCTPPIRPVCNPELSNCARMRYLWQLLKTLSTLDAHSHMTAR